MRRREKGRKTWIGRGWQSQQWRPARAFIIMIILDIPCPKQGQPASQPASEPASLRNFPSFPSFPILILFLPGRSGRHISRSGHKIHSPFPQPPRLSFSLCLSLLHPLLHGEVEREERRRERERRGWGDRGRENNPRFRLPFTLASPPPFPSFFSVCRSPRLRSVLLLINGGPAIFFSPATHSLGSVFLLLDVSFSFSRRKNSSRLINVSVARPLVPHNHNEQYTLFGDSQAAGQ